MGLRARGRCSSLTPPLERLTKLPAPPAITCSEVQPRPPGGRAFLGLARVTARCDYPDGTRSEPFLYDVVTRDAIDAVVVLPTFREDGKTFVILRSAIRVPMSLREATLGNLWELPAGLVEEGETPEEAGARELAEEVGAHVLARDLVRLGASVTPAPGAIAEVQHFVVAEIDPATLGVPTEDGSPLERNAALAAVPLDVALLGLATHGIVDAKTELGLLRLRDHLRSKAADPHDEGGAS